jgi:hypothetical protein
MCEDNATLFFTGARRYRVAALLCCAPSRSRVSAIRRRSLALNRAPSRGNLMAMSELLEEAMQVLRRLPDGMQDTAARAIIACAAAVDEQPHA